MLTWGFRLGASRLAERLGRDIVLTEEERSALRSLESQERPYRRGATVIAENDRPRDLFVVLQGWLHSSVWLGNGNRQIMRFHFPADLIGLPLLAFAEYPESVTAVTDVRLASFPRDRLAWLIESHPRLAAALLALCAAERVELADRLASIGRTPARARVASLLCDLFTRLRRAEGRSGDTIQLPLTQEEIGDATGLTAVHVNRMLRRLADDGIIARKGSELRLLDEARLAAEANFIDRSQIRLDWIPKARR